MMEDIFQKWRKESTISKKENLAFLAELSVEKRNKLSEILPEIHDDAFAKIDCLSCANCCRTTPALLIASDVRRISKFLNISQKQFNQKYVLEDVNGEMMLNGVPCKFLSPDNTCSVYEVRPEACRQYPHTNEKAYFKRPGLNAANTIVCPAAFYILEKLKSIAI
ncbi:MAG: YkgJ family cysteine cluster protein [Saprospiraceae bacterium]|nr:YkgJ family cysteine cluster protein [Saprospiraceae bacterium]